MNVKGDPARKADPWNCPEVKAWVARYGARPCPFAAEEYNEALDRLGRTEAAWLRGPHAQGVEPAAEYLATLAACLRMLGGVPPPWRSNVKPPDGYVTWATALCWHLGTGGKVDPFDPGAEPLPPFKPWIPAELEALFRERGPAVLASYRAQRRSRRRPDPIRGYAVDAGPGGPALGLPASLLWGAVSIDLARIGRALGRPDTPPTTDAE